MSRNRARVAIVGGGLAGLAAAWRLQGQGVHDVVLLEARERLGGRILGADAAGRPCGLGGAGHGAFDLGPAWYWPALQPALDALVDALGLQRVAQFEDGDMRVERSPHEAPFRVPGYRSEPTSMRLHGGMGALVDALRRALPADRVRCSHRVRRLCLADGQVEVHGEDERGEPAVWRVDHVLLALPPRLAVGALDFSPALPAALASEWAATDTWMAPHAKYLAVYDEPFWRARGLSGAARSACGPLAEIHDASLPGGPAALFGFVGVPARLRQGLPEDAMKAQCRAQLGRLFGAAALAPRADVFKDWAADPCTATAADLDGSGQHPVPPSREAATGPWQGRITGIGSEWSPRFPGYLAGALDAAERGVQAWLARSA